MKEMQTPGYRGLFGQHQYSASMQDILDILDLHASAEMMGSRISRMDDH